MREFRHVRVALLNDPPAPIRVAMDETKIVELSTDLRVHGMLQPILVRAVAPSPADGFTAPEAFTPDAWEAAGGRYEVVVGHRRQVAARMIGMKEVPAFVYPPGEQCGLGEMIAENFCREDVTAAEEGWALAEYIEQHQPSVAELCGLTGQSENWLNDRLALVREDPEVAQAVAERKVNFAVAKQLLRVNHHTAASVTRSDPENVPEAERKEIEQRRRYFLRLAVDSGATANVVRTWVDNWKLNYLPPKMFQPEPGSPVANPSPVPPQPLCIFCGSTDDQYNLLQIHIHRYHTQALKKALENFSVECNWL